MKLSMFLTPVIHFLLFSLLTLQTVFASPLTETEKSKDVLPLNRIPLKYFFGRPPELFSKDEMEQMINALINELSASLGIAPQPKLVLLDTTEWASYVNYGHFVPLTAEGIPQGYGINFTYPVQGSPKQFPHGEIIETGEMYIWWELCNVDHVNSQTCKEGLRSLIMHELRHYRQWLQIPVNQRLERWKDIRHYQCREVEVYNDQVNNGDADPSSLRSPFFLIYKKACQTSKWKNDFQRYLNK